MNVRPIVPLDSISSAHEALAGGKALNCARLKQAGFPVPDGVVVLSTASRDDAAAVAADPWFDGPERLYAVRSSGIGEDGLEQSFAGIHQTFLNVPRSGLAASVARCRESGGTAQAVAYRRTKGLSTEAIDMGVLVQRMIQPVAAGVAFTVHPVTGADNELVINSSWGIGEELVSGQVDPDEFVVRKDTQAPIWTRVGEKTGDRRSSLPSLSEAQLRELTSTLIAIERFFGAPQDVEWCHDGTSFWIVQARPVTVRATPHGSEIEWTRANLAEVLPEITAPQALAAFEDFLNKAERQHLGRMVAPEEQLGPMLKSFYGRLYFNLSQLRHVCAVGGVAPAAMLKSMGHAEAIDPADEAPARPPIGELLVCIPDLLRMLIRHLRVADEIRRHDACIEAFRARVSAVDPRTLSDGEIWAILEEWLDGSAEMMQAVLLLGGVLFHEAPVRKLCAKAGFPFERLVYPQLAAGERSVSARQAFDLIALAEVARGEPSVVSYLSSSVDDVVRMRIVLAGTAFLAAFERFLDAYGHRGRYESDWSLPRYAEDPAPLLQAVRAHLGEAPGEPAAEILRRQERESAESWRAFSAKLTTWQRWTLLPRVRRSIQKLKQYYLWRERLRSDMVRVLAVVRAWHLVLAGRFVERRWLERRDDYFLLHLAEIGAAIKGRVLPDRLHTIVAERRAETARYRTIRMPLLMRESELPRLVRTAAVSVRTSDDSTLSGYPVSSGVVEAEVVVVRDPADFDRMRPGAILVAPATDPSWTPLFTLASGVIVEIGGVLSHASTIAREYGLPAVANVRHATRRLRTGERIRLDAVNGLIHRLEPATEPARQS
jgi:rifampicin phosphotransferase